MRDFFIKARMLWWWYDGRGLFSTAREVWSLELDAQQCCDGTDCGCRGSTHRDEYEHYANKPTNQGHE